MNVNVRMLTLLRLFRDSSMRRLIIIVPALLVGLLAVVVGGSLIAWVLLGSLIVGCLHELWYNRLPSEDRRSRDRDRDAAAAAIRSFDEDEIKRMHDEMLNNFAPATEMPTQRRRPTKHHILDESDYQG